MPEIPIDHGDIDHVSVGYARAFVGEIDRDRHLSSMNGRDPAEIRRDTALRLINDLRAELVEFDRNRPYLASLPRTAENLAHAARVETAEAAAKARLSDAQAAFQAAQADAAVVEDAARLAAERRQSAAEAARDERVAALMADVMQASKDGDAAVAALEDAVSRRSAALTALRKEKAIKEDMQDWKSRGSTQRGVCVSASLWDALELPIHAMRPDLFTTQAKAAGVRERG